jgi:hypothetical protein
MFKSRTKNLSAIHRPITRRPDHVHQQPVQQRFIHSLQRRHDHVNINTSNKTHVTNRVHYSTTTGAVRRFELQTHPLTHRNLSRNSSIKHRAFAKKPQRLIHPRFRARVRAHRTTTASPMSTVKHVATSPVRQADSIDKINKMPSINTKLIASHVRYETHAPTTRYGYQQHMRALLQRVHQHEPVPKRSRIKTGLKR